MGCQVIDFTLLQFDDFAPDFIQVRNDLIAANPFSTITGPDGFEYTNVAQWDVPHWYAGLAECLGFEIKVRMSGFRLNLAGELPHSWVHSDDICAQFATVLYMNLPHQCMGGTAFWRHTGLFIDRMPDLEEMVRNGGNIHWWLAMVNKEWQSLDFWEQAGFVSMKPNRLITYPTGMFHSRYPFEGFGSGPEDGRMVWVCFYDRA
jgi:hypothetical protein